MARLRRQCKTPMRTPFSLRRRSWYPWVFAATSLAATAGLYAWKRDNLAADMTISVLGAIAGFFHFLYSQHETNTGRFVTLFKDFNVRFDGLNDRLNQLRAKGTGEVLTLSERQCLYDYFNLCAEEYLYFNAGYIDCEVWASWLRGMAYFAGNQEIRRIWASELTQDSYYGFSLAMLPSPI